MRAIVHDIYGSADVARLDDVPVPVPGPGDVLVRVRATSLNAIDLDYLHGRPAFARIGTGLRRPRLRTLGVDAAGEVEAVGASVTDLRPGDRVLGDLSTHAHGAFAEPACAPERAWIRMPATVSFLDAATIPHAALLAYQGLAGRGHGIRPGDRGLVDGASGNVGPWAVQLRRRGARRSRASAAPRRWTSSGRPARTTSSTTRATTSPAGPAPGPDPRHDGLPPDRGDAPRARAGRAIRDARRIDAADPRRARRGDR